MKPVSDERLEEIFATQPSKEDLTEEEYNAVIDHVQESLRRCDEELLVNPDEYKNITSMTDLRKYYS